ncbi:hypothetical protein [Mycobacteroides abscessus]|uniref:hypothetical protein n=1 Tax=Mycobacteroides abscessus TaxID=36809 RepID=UPI001F35D5A8|nr:hypothetical protein [Mycobacteroides abscessus]
MNRQTRIAVAAEFRKLADEIERDEKAEFLAENHPGTRLAVLSDQQGDDGQDLLIGWVSIDKPTAAHDVLSIDDETAAIDWVLEEFGDPLLATQKLSDQGRSTVLAAAQAAVNSHRPLPPGVSSRPVAAGRPVVKWKAESNARELLVDMRSRGVLDIPAALGLALEPVVIDSEVVQ